MKLTQIPKMAIEALHPLGMKCSTDMEYARIATEVAREMAKLKIDDISSDGLKLLSLNITMYFEDIVADAGIWRGFTSLVKSEQGRELPFFDVAPENYYVDEPDLNAVKFLVWYTMLEVHHGRVGNPDRPRHRRGNREKGGRQRAVLRSCIQDYDRPVCRKALLLPRILRNRCRRNDHPELRQRKQGKIRPYPSYAREPQRGYNGISVRELAERADINRGTFYIHYRDVGDLLQRLEYVLF